MIQLILLGIPLAFVIYTVYKGLNASIAMLIGALIVCLVERMDIMTTILGSPFKASVMIGGMQMSLQLFFLTFIMANIFAQIYLATGGARSIANTLTKLVVKDATGYKAKMRALYTFMVIAIIFGFGGLDAFVCVFTLLPIGMVMFEKYNIPRRLLPATLFAGVTTAVCCPGTPLTNGNILAAGFLGTQTTAAAVPGLVGVAVILLCDVLYLRSAVKKAEAKGEGWTPVPNQAPSAAGINDDTKPVPKAWQSFIPIIVVAIMNMILHINIVISLLTAALVACATMCNYIVTPQSKLKPYMALGEKGVVAAGMTFVPMAIQMGLATVIQNSGGFEFLSGLFTQMAYHTNPLIAWATSASLTGFLAGNSTAGIQLSASIFQPIASEIGLSLSAAHRIGCFAISILDTIPINAAIISALFTTGLTQKEGYPPIFRTTVLYIFFGMIAVILMCMLFPGLQ